MKKIIKQIQKYKKQYEKQPLNQNAKPVDRKEFTLLLGGISACRKMPGVNEHMGYEELYHCTNPEDIQKGRNHLQQVFGVKDKESLMEACYQLYPGSEHYEQFMTFWRGAPLFALEELNENGREGFLYCKQLAELFYPIVEEKGFYAWDINERIGLCRNAAVCEIITDEEFWEITDVWVRQAQVFYHSYVEYGMSCLCGAIYEMAQHEEDVQSFLEINRNLLDNLLGEGGAWNRNQWYTPKEREWASLLKNNLGCLVTKRALEEGIGYMYREEPCANQPDSGWRFFVGDEPEEYVNNSDNIQVCGLNTICNLHPDIMPYIYAEMGRSFGRRKNGWVEE